MLLGWEFKAIRVKNYNSSNYREEARQPYIKDLKIFILLLYKELFIELFNEVHFFIPMNEMTEWFENSSILYRKDFQRNIAASSIKYQ